MISLDDSEPKQLRSLSQDTGTDNGTAKRTENLTPVQYEEIVHAVALAAVRTRHNVKNALYAVATENAPSWRLWQKVPGETQGQPPEFWSWEYKGSEACYNPKEKEILAAYEGVQAASEVIVIETQLLLAPQPSVLGWMFKGKLPSTQDATDGTWNKGHADHTASHSRDLGSHRKLA
ncbi:hypothetical protein WISP_23248 [Willisornis vidua]|uniref:Reverse transcriptase/retrotransposon-derived protein RNase H-like domain-containing protein n=1 Tax=Willisornis vidua TaxID=1566151 RepID=A0ABQ9DMI8_9PASS|nr:hypothetical protein WISP_23248 [Willisornis vidua]